MTYSAVNTIWVLFGAAMVFFMQAGFFLCVKQVLPEQKIPEIS